MRQGSRLLKEFVRVVLLEKAAGPISGGWQPWPANVKNVPYEPKQKGVGPGEERLAKILDGTVQGGGESYDIVDAKGRKWEVKEPSGGLRGEIRPGTEGLAAVQDAFSRIKNVVKRVENVFGTKAMSRTAGAAGAMMGPEVIGKITSFVTQEAPMLMKGEVSKGRMEALAEVLHLINAALRTEEGDDQPATASGTKHVEMGDTEHKVEQDVDLNTYVKLGHVLKLGPKDLGVTPGDVLRSTFNGLAFRNPDKFMETVWKQAAMASVVFGHTSGVILVAVTGYRIVPKADLDNVLVFNRITKGFPHFKASG